MDFYTAKNLGGVGALLLFVSVFPFLNYYGIISLVGLVLLLIALKGFADYYKEAGIFNNALYATIIAIVGAVVLAATLFTAAIGFLKALFPMWNGDLATLPLMTSPDVSTINFDALAPFLAAILLSFILLFVFVIVVAFLYRKSLQKLSYRSGVGLFASAGTVLLAGAVLTIIIIGLLIVWVSVLLIAIAFFQMRPEPVHVPPAATTPPPTSV